MGPEASLSLPPLTALPRDERLFICKLATDPTEGATPSIPYQFATDRALSQMSNSEARYD